MLTLNVKNLEGVWFGAALSDSKIYATAFAFNRLKVFRRLLENIPFDKPFMQVKELSSFAHQVIAILFDIYSGKDVFKGFPLILDHLTPYTRRILETVALIPLGYVASYGSVANAAGGSPRSVGRTLKYNPFPLIIPCHRVVASNFSLGGYGMGLKVKRDILMRERRAYRDSLEISSEKGRLRVFPVEFVFKIAGSTLRSCNANIKSQTNNLQ